MVLPRIRSVFTAVILLILGVGGSSAFAQATVKGHIEDFDGPQRLARPGRTSTLSPHSATPGANKKGLSLSAGTTGSLLLPNAFKLGAKGLTDSRPLQLPGKAADTPVDEHSKELTVAWDEWHKRVISALYQRWKEGADVSGEAKVTIVVTRDGRLDCSLDGFEQSGAATYDPGVESAFRHEVETTVSSLERNSILEFPPMSQRKQVKLVTTFSMNMFGPSGYTYKHGDYEHVHTPGK